MNKEVLSRDLASAIRNRSCDNLMHFYRRHQKALDMSLITFYRAMNAELVSARTIHLIEEVAGSEGISSDEEADVNEVEAFFRMLDAAAKDGISDDAYNLARERLFAYWRGRRDRITRSLQRLKGKAMFRSRRPD